MRKPLTILAALATLALPTPALADVSDLAKAALSADSVAARGSALTELQAADAGDPLAAYAIGSVEFFMALEKLAQGLHRHGFESPRSFMLPLMRLPVPANRDPEPLTYEGFRNILLDFRDGMAQSAATLGTIPLDAEIGLDVDLAVLRIDLDEDGRLAPNESAQAIIAALAGGGAPDALPQTLGYRFDRADGYWLQGYANFLMAQADFWLAHDFRLAFDQSFHMLFPKAKLPMQDTLVPLDNGTGSMFASEWRIADFISFVHLVNWPIVEPERSRAARAELLEMIRLSRENWKAILAETDDDREWLAGPHQKEINPLAGFAVSEADIQAWHGALQLAEDLLEGRKLLPHFRFADKGISIKRFFDEPRTFDLVLSITGPGVAPYLESGDILTAAEWEDVRRRFTGAGLMTIALWFN